MGKAIPAEAAVQLMLERGFKPLGPYPGAGNPWPCVCVGCGRHVVPSYHSARRGDRCKWCAIRAMAAKRMLDPSMAEHRMREANRDPLVAYPGSEAPWPCICLTCNQPVSPRYSSIRSGQGGCDTCGKKRGGAKIRRDPDAAAELMLVKGLAPIGEYPGANVPWPSVCSQCGNTVAPTLQTVARGGGCRYCAGNVRLTDAAASSVVRAAGLEPLCEYPGATTPWRCRCVTCGRAQEFLYNSAQQGHGCAWCAGNVRLSHAAAAAVMRAAHLEPLTPYPGAAIGWACSCTKCGRETRPSYASVNGGGGCKWCGIAVRARTLLNDPELAAEAMRAAGLEPLEPYAGTAAPWLGSCLTCGRTSTPRHGNIVHGGGCRFCSSSGFRFDQPGIVYVVTHREWAAHKVGIKGVQTARLRKHQKNGWQLYRTMYFADGAVAYSVEQAVLRWMRSDLGLGPFLAAPTDGWSETVDADALALPTMWEAVVRFAGEDDSDIVPAVSTAVESVQAGKLTKAGLLG